MAQEKTDKQLVRRRKFIDVEVPIIRSKIELIGESASELKNRTINLDMTRQLKGKSVELVLRINLVNDKPVASPYKIKLMAYFIRRMIRKRISYVEDSFQTPSQDSMLIIKPFLITKRRVSRRVRKTLRNKTKNYIEDYIAERKDEEIFSEILSNRMQKSLSLYLKKTYPLSLCEIRVLEIIRPLKAEEIPKIKPKEKLKERKEEAGEYIDQMKEIEDEKILKAEKEIKETQERAATLSKSKDFEPATKKESSTANLEFSESKEVAKEDVEKKPKKPKAKKEKVEKKE